MRIDPVVVLAEELRHAEQILRDARAAGDETSALRALAKISLLNEELYEVVPTSALGAAELLYRVAMLLPQSAAPYSLHTREIADRLACGERNFPDLVWLRSMGPALTGGLCGEAGVILAPLVTLAVAGASRPVLVFRSVLPPPRDNFGLRTNPPGSM